MTWKGTSLVCDSQYVLNTGMLRGDFADQPTLADPRRTDDVDDTAEAAGGFLQDCGGGVEFPRTSHQLRLAAMSALVFADRQ